MCSWPRCYHSAARRGEITHRPLPTHSNRRNFVDGRRDIEAGFIRSTVMVMMMTCYCCYTEPVSWWWWKHPDKRRGKVPGEVSVQFQQPHHLQVSSTQSTLQQQQQQPISSARKILTANHHYQRRDIFSCCWSTCVTTISVWVSGLDLGIRCSWRPRGLKCWRKWITWHYSVCC